MGRHGKGEDGGPEARIPLRPEKDIFEHLALHALGCGSPGLPAGDPGPDAAGEGRPVFRFVRNGGRLFRNAVEGPEEIEVAAAFRAGLEVLFDRGALPALELAVMIGPEESLEFTVSHLKLSSPGNPPGAPSASAGPG